MRQGRLYVYRVLAPQRGTLEIRLTGGKPQIGEFKLSCNRKPDPATVKAVKACSRPLAERRRRIFPRHPEQIKRAAMLLAETNAELLADGTLRFQIPGWQRTRYLLARWERGFTSVCDRVTHRFPAIAWSVAPVPPAGAKCEPNPVVDAFISRIPPEARARVQPYQYGQCLLLSMLAASTEARDLADSNPNLFWLLAVAVNDRRIASGQIASLCRMKQAEILRVLSGTGSKAQVRFLRKVREGTAIGGRLLLEAAGNSAIVHALRHRSEMPIDLVQMLTICPGLAREDLVPVIAAQVTESTNIGPERLKQLQRALSFLEILQDDLIGRTFRDRLEDMMRFARDRLLALDTTLPSLDEVCWEPAAFPPPLLPGTVTIVPITSLKELEAEGLKQRHCAVNYAHARLRGPCVFLPGAFAATGPLWQSDFPAAGRSSANSNWRATARRAAPLRKPLRNGLLTAQAEPTERTPGSRRQAPEPAVFFLGLLYQAWYIVP